MANRGVRDLKYRNRELGLEIDVTRIVCGTIGRTMLVVVLLIPTRTIGWQTIGCEGGNKGQFRTTGFTSHWWVEKLEERRWKKQCFAASIATAVVAAITIKAEVIMIDHRNTCSY